MTAIKPSSHGIVVENKDNGMHYAVSDINYNPAIHRKVRDLKAGETVRSYKPRRSETLSEIVGSGETEGSAPADAQG